jgi:DNA-binding transcriptional regulator GbsR (MarR family)
MDDLDKEVIEFFTNMGKAFGWDELTSKVVAVLYMEAEPIAMEEIAKKTGYSLSSISNVMKMLEGFGIVTRVKKQKSRKAFFLMEKDLGKASRQKFLRAYEYGIKPAKEFLPGIIKKYESRKPDEETKKKLALLRLYYMQFQCVDKIFTHMLEDIESAFKSEPPKPYKP